MRKYIKFPTFFRTVTNMHQGSLRLSKPWLLHNNGLMACSCNRLTSLLSALKIPGMNRITLLLSLSKCSHRVMQLITLHASATSHTCIAAPALKQKNKINKNCQLSKWLWRLVVAVPMWLTLNHITTEKYFFEVPLHLSRFRLQCLIAMSSLLSFSLYFPFSLSLLAFGIVFLLKLIKRTECALEYIFWNRYLCV